MSGQVRVYCRPSGAMGHGHVGFAFRAPGGQWTAGAIENPSSGPITSPGETGLWSAVIAEAGLASEFKKRDYTHYKALTVSGPQWHAARAALAEWTQKPYELVGKNCLDATFDLLTRYGAKLANPSEHPRPNDWFRHFPSSEKPV